MSILVTNSAEIIDSRDVISRFEELESERDNLLSDIDDIESGHYEGDDGDLPELLPRLQREYQEWEEEYGDEFKILEQLNKEGLEATADWHHGATMIRHTYFPEYCEESEKDMGTIPKDFPSYIVIDWEATAENLADDYTEIRFEGVSYYVR